MQAEGNKACGQLKEKEARLTPCAGLQPGAALPGGELRRAFPSPSAYGGGVFPELTPPLSAGQAPGRRLSQDKTPPAGMQ